MSVRTTIIVALNLVAIAVGVAVGFGSGELVSRTVEERLVHSPAANMARLIDEMHLPITDAMLERMGTILDCRLAVVLEDRVVAASLPAGAGLELQKVAGSPTAEIDGRKYRIGRSTIAMRPGTDVSAPELLLLFPEDALRDAQRRVEWRIGAVTAVAVSLATIAGGLLAAGICRPIRRLAAEMDQLAQQPGALPPPPAVDPVTGPTEVAALSQAFHHLLTRLADAQHRLDRSARLAAVGRLAAATVHELRNPLSGIKMNARVLADEMRRAGNADRSLELIVREIDRMDLYLQELLQLRDAQIPESEIGAAATAIQLPEVADEVVELLGARLAHAGIVLRRDYRGTAPAYAEPSRVRQVVLNLLLNAVEAMPGGGRIVVSTEDRSGTVRLTVEDQGAGVPPGHDVFEPFVTSKSDGVGLGLFICRGLIERSRGRIGYENREGGAMFWFELPTAPASRDEDDVRTV